MGCLIAAMPAGGGPFPDAPDRVASQAVGPGDGFAWSHMALPSCRGRGGEDEPERRSAVETDRCRARQWLMRQQRDVPCSMSRVAPPKIHSRSLEWP
jgi:hypothetical protein